MRDEILRLASSGQIADEDLDRLERKAQALKAAHASNPGDKAGGFAPEAEATAGAIQRLRAIQSLQKQNPGLDAAKAGLAEIQAAFSALPIASFTQLQSAGRAADAASKSSDCHESGTRAQAARQAACGTLAAVEVEAKKRDCGAAGSLDTSQRAGRSDPTESRLGYRVANPS